MRQNFFQAVLGSLGKRYDLVPVTGRAGEIEDVIEWAISARRHRPRYDSRADKGNELAPHRFASAHRGRLHKIYRGGHAIKRAANPRSGLGSTTGKWSL